MYDKNVNERGGLHVIQTYISSDYSEYVQIRGRTARQGNKGSFEMIIG
jgi:preprotein translocase subunit SecA